MKKEVSLKTAKEYIALVLNDVPRKEAASRFKLSPATIEKSDSYLTLHGTMVSTHRQALTAELEQLQLKKTKAYSTLLDEGNRLMDEAETIDDRIKAQENQRRNLDVNLIEQAQAWNSEDRNHSDPDLPEGIILS